MFTSTPAWLRGLNPGVTVRKRIREPERKDWHLLAQVSSQYESYTYVTRLTRDYMAWLCRCSVTAWMPQKTGDGLLSLSFTDDMGELFEGNLMGDADEYLFNVVPECPELGEAANASIELVASSYDTYIYWEFALKYSQEGAISTSQLDVSKIWSFMGSTQPFYRDGYGR